MRYLALDFETGNASPLSACALGASVFEDNQLVDEKISLIRPPECVGRFHWGNVRVNHIKEKMVADAPSFAEVVGAARRHRGGQRHRVPQRYVRYELLCSCLAHYGLKMPECRYLCTVKVSKRVWPELENHKLDTVSAALHIDLNHHEAGSDARAAGLILQAALRRTGSADADALAEKSACGSAGFPRWENAVQHRRGTPKPREHRRTARPRNTVKRKGENKL